LAETCTRDPSAGLPVSGASLALLWSLLWTWLSLSLVFGPGTDPAFDDVFLNAVKRAPKVVPFVIESANQLRNCVVNSFEYSPCSFVLPDGVIMTFPEYRARDSNPLCSEPKQSSCHEPERNKDAQTNDQLVFERHSVT
jgi:hypothetical protein